MAINGDEDETIELHLRLYSPRWGHDDTYTIKLTRHLLTVYLDMRGAECAIDGDGQVGWQGYREGSGNPLLALFENDAIYAPAVVPSALEWALAKWSNKEVSRDEIATAIQDLFSWISFTARQKPSSEFWKEYF